MTPEEYEHHVAQRLRGEGWDARVTPYVRDFGIDVIAERDGIRLGVQAKMFGGANRAIGVPDVMQTYGAAHYADCSEIMIATDGRVLDDARAVAQKLGVDIRIIAAAGGPAAAPAGSAAGHLAAPSFGEIWSTYVVPLAGTVLTRDNGVANEILAVDDAGVVRRTSTGARQQIEIEIFRWAIERLLRGDTITRDEINQHYTGRASSGITLILSSIPIFEMTKVGRRGAIRMRQ
jgi:Restriction endonuclease